MRNVFSTPVRNVVLATIAGSFVATAALVSAAPNRPVIRPESAIRPDAVATSDATNLYAGGATLPAIAYEGSDATTLNPGVSSKTAVAGSAFQYFAKNISANKSSTTPDQISYCQTGSGFGKRILAGVDYTQPMPYPTVSAVHPCPALGVSPTDASGFGAKGQGYADFTGSDAPLSQTEFTAVSTYSKRGQAVQIPVIAGAVAIFYNNPDLASGNSISDASICNIAAGNYTNWDQIPDFSPRLPSRALSFVFRSDGSGTTFSFTNHEHAVCGSLANNFGVSQNFKYNSMSDVGAFPQASGTSTSATPSPAVPATFVGASGNPGVVNAIVANPGYVGYTEAANAKAALGSSPPAGVNYLLVNGRDPFADLPNSVTALGNTSALLNMAIPAPTSYGSAPAPVALSGASGSCVLTVNPALYANPTTTNAYGILGVTNLEFHSAGNHQNEALDLQLLAPMFYLSSHFGSGRISTVDAAGASGKTGFSALSGSTSSTLGKQVESAAKCIGA